VFDSRLRYLFIFLLGGYSYLNILFTEGYKIFGYDVEWYFLLITLLILVLLIWEGNRLIQHHFIQRLRDRKPSYRPLLIFFALSLVWVLIISTITSASIPLFIDKYDHSTFFHFKLTIGFTFRVNLFLHSINAIIFYNNRLRLTQVEAESLKKKNLEARFEALRNQINPHFLFNSLNVLSTLVYKDADTSAKFIEQLSKVYRYLLYYQEKKVVSVDEELEFLKSYIYLLSIRFEDNLSIEIDVDEKVHERFIAPASLQLLIENAIKHNIVSGKRPLYIKIYVDKDMIIVENNLQLKELKEPSTSVGLKNIEERYQFISKESIKVYRNEAAFKVGVPLIKLAEI